MLEKINFYTIKKKEFSYYSQKMIDKTFRFYTKIGKSFYFPPTEKYIYNEIKRRESEKLSEKNIGIIKKEIDLSLIEKFKDNIFVQNEVMDQIKTRNEFYNYKCGLIKLTTGKGKGHVIIDIINYYQVPTLILVHNIKTLNETIGKFKEFTNKIPCIYGDGKKNIGEITICTKRSFCIDSEKFIGKFNLVLIDEAPVQFTKDLWDSLNICFDGDNIGLYGLSGTPYTDFLNKEDLEKYFGKIIEVKGQANNGYNIIPTFTFYDYKYRGYYEYENPAELRGCLSINTDRTNKIFQIIESMSKGRNCLLIMTDRKDEVDLIYDYFYGKDGYGIFKITGDTKTQDDNKNIEFLDDKDCMSDRNVIVGTIQKVGIGMDIPFVDTILLIPAIKFKGAVIQAIGRGLRKYEGKENVIVGVFNDLPHYAKQKAEKLKTIKEEYLINRSEIEMITIGKRVKVKI